MVVFILKIVVYLTEQLSREEYAYVPEGFKIKLCTIKLSYTTMKTKTWRAP